MIVTYEFNYINENALIAHFLLFYARKSALEFCLKKEASLISLFVRGGEDEILKFSDEAMPLIPNSIFLAKSSVRVVDEGGAEAKALKFNGTFEGASLGDLSKFFEDEISNARSTAKFNNFTPRVMKEYLARVEPSQNEFGIISGTSVLHEGKFEAVSRENFARLLEFCRINLFHARQVQIKRGGATFTLKADVDFSADFLIAAGVGALDGIFVSDEKSKIALAAFEKPLISLKTNAIFRKNHEDTPKFFDVKLAGDIFVFALGRALASDGIYFLSAKCESAAQKDKIFKVAPLQNGFLIVQNEDFLSDAASAYLKNSKDKNSALFTLTCREKGVLNDSKKRVLRCFLGVGADDEIAIYGESSKKILLKFDLPRSFDELKAQICADETGAKLLENFSAKFNVNAAKIDEILKSANAGFHSIFNVAAQLIWGRDAAFLIASAEDFAGGKGVRLDFCTDERGCVQADKILRSAMSYALAGANEKLFAFGFFDSLGYFLSDLADERKEDFDVLIFGGAMFSGRKFADLMLKLCKNFDASFSDSFALQAR